jgi:hypothetical protein
MPEPCQQANAIGKLEATTESIGKTLDRLSDVLGKIASQGTKIDTLEDGQQILFNRFRDIELSAESQKVKVGIIMAGISAISSSVTVFVVKHFGGH